MLRSADIQSLLLPYHIHLGISLRQSSEQTILVMPFSDHIVGNKTARAVHGGAIGAFLEFAAQLAIQSQLPHVSMQVIDVNVDYLRAVGPADSFAVAEVVKAGRQVINVVARMWQEHEDKAVAVLRGHYSITKL